MRKRSRLSKIFEARAEFGTESKLFYIVARPRPSAFEVGRFPALTNACATTSDESRLEYTDSGRIRCDSFASCW